MTVNRRNMIVAGSAAATLLASSQTIAQAPLRKEEVAPSPSGLPSNEKKLRIVTLRDLEAEAQKVMAPFGFAYVAGGAGDEWTLRENLAAFNRWTISPDFMNGQSAADTSTTILGTRISYPVMTAPLGNQGSVHALKEAPNVKGTSAAGTIYCNSSVSQLSLEEIATASEGPKWFQLYVPRDRGFARELLQRAKASGYKAIVLTADVQVTSNRERSVRLQGAAVPSLAMGNVPKTPGSQGNAMDIKGDMDWNDVDFCRKETGLPVVLKSILYPRHAVQAVRSGCAAVWLSNHGGRQLDNTPSAITTLPQVAAAVKGQVPIIVDGGIYRGQDVFRAIALGASAVAIGRPTLYGSALGGAQGVQDVHEHLKRELQMVMRLAGTPDVSSITPDCVARADGEA